MGKEEGCQPVKVEVSKSVSQEEMRQIIAGRNI